MSELYDNQGNPIEGALTPEEVEKKLDEIKEQTRREIEEEREGEIKDLQLNIEELERTIKEKDEEIEKVGKKDYNWQKLRGQKEEFKKQLDEAKEDLKKVVEGVQVEISQKKVDDKVNALAGGNKELAEKIKFYYKEFRIDEETDPVKREENFNKRMEQAFILAVGGKISGALDSRAIGTGGGRTIIPGAGATGKISEEGKEVAKKMGITDEELKNQGLID